MSLTSLVGLLKAVLALLVLVDANPQLPWSVHDMASQIAHQVISQASTALSAPQSISQQSGGSGSAGASAVTSPSGSYNPPTVTEIRCPWNGSTLGEGQSVTAYQSSSPINETSCVSEQRTCWHGTLTGSYIYASCAQAGDTTVPSVSISSPASGATLSATTTVTASVSDNGGVAGVTFKIDDVAIAAEDTVYPYQIEWNPSSVSDGTHVITAVARDQAGNSSVSSVTVTVSIPKTVATCSFKGQTVQDGGSVAAFKTDSVAYGSACVSEQRTCLQGALSGTYTYASCSVGATGQCSDQKKAEILAPATLTDLTTKVNCSLTLAPTDVISKRLIFEGSGASGANVACNGAKLLKTPYASSGFRIEIMSDYDATTGLFDRPTDITISGCDITGRIGVYGANYASGTVTYLLQSSHSLGYTQRMRDASPTRVTFDNIKIEGDGLSSHLYVYPGVTHLTVRNSQFTGLAKGPPIYLDMETGFNTFTGNIFDATSSSIRETIAVDGSSDNLFENNTFRGVKYGSIYIYRNCGEQGIVRQNEPRRNVIRGNIFDGAKGYLRPVVWVSSRPPETMSAAMLAVCHLDDGYPFGSGIDDHSFAQDNSVTGNIFLGIPQAYATKVSEQPNTISDNSFQP